MDDHNLLQAYLHCSVVLLYNIIKATEFDRIHYFIFSAALGQCAEDKLSLKVIHDLDGVRLLWSLLKNPSARVNSNHLIN